MDKMENLILIYGSLLFSTVFVLSYLAYPLQFYLTAFALEFFLAVLVTSPYNRAESRRQMVIGVLLIVIFIGVAVEQVIMILR